MAKRTRIHNRTLIVENQIWLRYLAGCRAWARGFPESPHMSELEAAARINPRHVRALRLSVARQRIRPFTEADIPIRRACVELAERRRIRGAAPDTMPAVHATRVPGTPVPHP